jgi:hypothetical protein
MKNGKLEHETDGWAGPCTHACTHTFKDITPYRIHYIGIEIIVILREVPKFQMTRVSLMAIIMGTEYVHAAIKEVL